MENITVDINTLHTNSWNSNVMSPSNEAKLVKSIKRHGMFKPIICREGEEGLEIIGGEHRYLAAKTLNMQTVPIVNMGKITDVKAKEISLIDNGRYGNDDFTKLNELLAELDGQIVVETMPFTDADLECFRSTNNEDILTSLENIEQEESYIEPSQMKSVQTHKIIKFKIPIERFDEINNEIKIIQQINGFMDNDLDINAGDALIHILFGEDDE